MSIAACTAATLLASAPVASDDVWLAVETTMVSQARPGETPPAPPAAPSPPADAQDSEILVTAGSRASPGDPLEKVNAQSFEVTRAVDQALFGPVALAYQQALPKPLRNGLRNFLNNLHEPDVFLNFLLQVKPGKALETLARFAINSTLGLAGVFDVAKRRPFRLPRRANGFADTLGFYGVGPGPFFYLPLIGPTTLRDLIGNNLDRLLLPLAVGKPFNRPAYTIPAAVLSTLDRRAENDEALRARRNGETDPYVATREFYLQRRQAEIDGLRGQRERVR